jgi:K+-sensing histidine kinase KdpD
MKKLLFTLVLSFSMLATAKLYAQEVEIKKIEAQRAASNEALRNFDEDLNSTFMTDDVLITTGAGILLSGKAELMAYVKNTSGRRMYLVRTPDEILVNSLSQLAWEKGTWEGFYEDSTASIVGGNYAAQWTKISGVWLMKSQLFITLPK